MKSLLQVSVLAAVAATSTSIPYAEAQTVPCGPRESIVQALDGKYEERRIGAGLQPGRGVVEVYASESGSWTLLLTLPNGAACILGAGEAWADDPLEAEVAGDPA